MKPEDVTTEMERVYFGDVYSKRDRTLKEEIAAAFNAVANDAEPITAERLLENGYVAEADAYYRERVAYYREIEPGTRIGWDGVDVAIVNIDGATILLTKTIGQLRALHAGLGIGEVK